MKRKTILLKVHQFRMFVLKVFWPKIFLGVASSLGPMALFEMLRYMCLGWVAMGIRLSFWSSTRCWFQRFFLTLQKTTGWWFHVFVHPYLGRVPILTNVFKMS